MESKQAKPKFNCADIEKRVNAYIDNRLSHAEIIQFQEHLDYCLPCDKKIEFEQKLKELVRLKAKETNYPQKLDLELKKIIRESDN
jgi:anti-sigma factor (TIGR02949 family)